MSSSRHEKILEYLEVAFHNILFAREVYPVELFERRRKYGVAVRMSRHPKLNCYIHSVVRGLRQWLDTCTLERVSLVIFDSKRRAIEEFSFDMAFKNLVSSRNFNDVSDAFSASLTKMELLDLPTPEKDCTFQIFAYAPPLDNNNSNRQSRAPWIAATDEETCNRKSGTVLIPVKSIQDDEFRMQVCVFRF